MTIKGVEFSRDTIRDQYLEMTKLSLAIITS